MFKLFDRNKRILKKLEKQALEVLALEDAYKQLSDDELKAKTDEFRKRLETETMDDILVEAFATVKEASTRVLGINTF